MAVHIKTTEEIAKMRTAGRLAAEVLEMIGPHVRPGISTGELDRLCHEHIVKVQEARPAPLNYRGFPRSICTSVNHVVCHGIPSEKKTLKGGDIINIDVTVVKDDYHGDTSMMFAVGKVAAHARRLMQTARECLCLAIDMVRPGARLGDIGHVIERHATKNHYSVVRDFCGHGIGLNFHEDPQVLHYGTPGTGLELCEGMTFTIEPILNAGKHHVVVSRHDGWTAETCDKRLSAQWEHTLAVSKNGCEVLTARTGETL